MSDDWHIELCRDCWKTKVVVDGEPWTDETRITYKIYRWYR